MRKLLRQIKRELKTAKTLCYLPGRTQPRLAPTKREPKVARFAEDHGFRLRFYRDGLCAIF